MGRMKELFMKLMEEDFFKSPFQHQGFLKDNPENYTEESFEVTKNGVKTEITYKFNEAGYPIGWSHVSKPTTTLSQLQEQLDTAVKAQNFELAAQIKQLMDDIRKNTPAEENK